MLRFQMVAPKKDIKKDVNKNCVTAWNYEIRQIIPIRQKKLGAPLYALLYTRLLAFSCLICLICLI